MSLLSVENALSVEVNPKVELTKFICDLCEKLFDKKGPLANHRNHVHTIKTKEMYCDFCDDIFQSKIDLCSHISSKHSEHVMKKESNNATILEENEKKSEPVTKVEPIAEPETKGGKQDVNKQEPEKGGKKVKI